MTRDLFRPQVTGAPRAATVTRRALTVAAVVLTASGLAACNKLSPQQTDGSYSPADGVDISLGQVQVRNLFVVAKDKGQEGRLGGMVVNQGQQPVEVTFSLPAAEGAATSPVKATVEPGASVSLDHEGLSLPAVPVKPGAMTNVLVGTPTSGQQSPLVPVLAPTGPYASMTAGSSGSGSSGSESATASGSESATASGTESATPSATESATPSVTTPAGTPSPAATTTAG